MIYWYQQIERQVWNLLRKVIILKTAVLNPMKPLLNSGSWKTQVNCCFVFLPQCCYNTTCQRELVLFLDLICKLFLSKFIAPWDTITPTQICLCWVFFQSLNCNPSHCTLSQYYHLIGTTCCSFEREILGDLVAVLNLILYKFSGFVVLNRG